MARSAADLPLVLQAISGPDGHDPEVPSVPWQQAGPVELTGLQAAYWLGFLPWSPEGSRARHSGSSGNSASMCIRPCLPSTVGHTERHGLRLHRRVPSTRIEVPR